MTSYNRVGKLAGALMRGGARKAWYGAVSAISSEKRKKELAERVHFMNTSEITRILGDMKSVYAKFGQILSFSSIATDNKSNSLKTLQKEMPPMAFSLARQVIEEELGGDLAQFFKHVDEEPVAAASIGQVHRAELLDGTEVAVKVQYPGILEIMEEDIGALSGYLSMAGKISKDFDASGIIDEIKARLSEECDYALEAAHQEEFGLIWKDSQYIHIPKVYREFTRKRILCQEFVTGVDYYEFLEHADKTEKSVAVHVLYDFVFESMFSHGIFNADPHPGNYLFQEGGVISFLDFGSVKRFSPSFLNSLRQLIGSIVDKDMKSFEHSMRDLKIVRELIPYNEKVLWKLFSYHADPYLNDEPFEFSEEWTKKGQELVNPKNLKEFNLPPDMVLFMRITFGLNWIFRDLGARERFGIWHKRHLRPELKAPTALEILEGAGA